MRGFEYCLPPGVVRESEKPGLQKERTWRDPSVHCSVPSGAHGQARCSLALGPLRLYRPPAAACSLPTSGRLWG